MTPFPFRIATLALTVHQLLCMHSNFAASFTIRAKPSPGRQRSFLSSLGATRARDVDAPSRPVQRRSYQNLLETKDSSALTFSGEIIKTSPPLVEHSGEDKASLIEFFKSTDARDLLFVSDTTPKPVDPIPSEILNEWRAEAKSLGAAEPDPETDAVFELSSNAINFSGLNVQTTVYCGAKLIEEESSDEFPVYEFTMIKDITKANGPKFLLWIYNQVMNFAARYSKNDKTTRSLCLVTLQENTDGVCLHFESSFQARMQFPPFLIKILPISKERAEKQGSSAVSNFVEKGVMRSLNRFENAFKR